MMYEWLAAMFAGLGGAVVGVVFTDVRKALLQRAAKTLPADWLSQQWPLLLLDLLGGTLASFLAWLTYTHNSWSSIGIAPSEVGAALVVGLGGSQALSVLLRGARQMGEWEQSIEKNVDGLEEMDQRFAELQGVIDQLLRERSVDTPTGAPDTQSGEKS